MCKQVICPNDGKPTWWGCGGHIEIALAGVPEAARCQCEHVPVAGKPGVYEVAAGDKHEKGDQKDEVKADAAQDA